MRRIAGGGVAVAIVMLTALPVAASAAATVVPSSVDRSTMVPARGGKSLTLTCPDRSVALHAAPVSLPSGVRVSDSGPGADVRRWKLRLASVAGASRRVRATLRCVSLNLPSGVSDVTLRVSTNNRPNLHVSADSTVSLSIRCPSGYIATGLGVGMSTRAVKLVAAVPNRSGWVVRVKNNGSSAARARAHVRCLQRVISGLRDGARTALGFGIKRVAYSTPVSAGKSRSVTGSCAPNRFSLGTGISLDSDDDISLLRSFPFGGRQGSWFFRNRGPRERVTSYLLCLSRASRFR
jgi:hypothetical protein